MLALGWVFVATAATGSAQTAAAPVAETLRDLDKPIVVGASEVFYPYSYRGDDGRLQGFAVDLTDAVARVANLSFERVTVPNPAIGDALRSGQIDVIQFWSETPSRRPWADFSVPIVTFETVVIARKDDTRIRTLADLRGRRVAVGQKGTVGERYLLDNWPDATPVYTETSLDFLRGVSTGVIDAAVMSRITAVSMFGKFGLENLGVLEARIPGSTYDVRYCFTVRRGDSLLLARLNEGLAILHRTGEFDRIYFTWFGQFETRRFTRLEVVTYVAAALALACIATLWGWLRQRTLSRRILGQTAELAEQRSLLAALHEKHPLATTILDMQSGQAATLVSLNPEAARLFGIDAATPAGARLDLLPLHPDFRDYLGTVLTHGEAGAPSGVSEHRIPSTQHLLETTIIQLGAPDIATRRICILSADITHRRLAEQELAQSRRLRALGELVGGIAHEFNNLLTPIIGTINLLRNERADDSALQGDLGMVDQAARRAADLTRRLLTFGRKTDDQPLTVDIADAVKNCFAMLRPTVDRRVEWHADIPTHLPSPVINPVDLNQVLFNLVINARDTLLSRLAHTHDNSWTPRLSVTATTLPAPAHNPGRPLEGHVIAGWIRITVEDNGEGIPPGVIERIFEPFFTTKEVGKGTGLGLATVWHTVTEAGGDVSVDSRPGSGTRFHLLLPHWEAGPAAAPAHAPATPPRRASTPASGCHILLAEDEAMVARTTIALLKRLGHTVTHVPDGEAAWRRFEKNTREFDQLLCDVNMPGLSGVDFVRRVRETGYTGRIVMMSGRVDEQDVTALRELKVDAILPKPFLPDELKAAMAPAAVPPPG